MAEVFDFGLQQHKIKMDGKFFENNLFAVAGDTGRRLEVQLLDSDNLVQNTTGISLRLNANVAGQATYAEATLVDATKGLYELDLPNGMLIAPGNWQFQWQIIGTNGKKLHSFAFTGSVGSNLSEGGSEATNFYLNADDLKQMQEDLINGTFNSEVLETNIAEKLNNLEEQYAPKLTEVTAQLAQKTNSEPIIVNNFAPNNFAGDWSPYIEQAVQEALTNGVRAIKFNAGKYDTSYRFLRSEEIDIYGAGKSDTELSFMLSDGFALDVNGSHLNPIKVHDITLIAHPDYRENSTLSGIKIDNGWGKAIDTRNVQIMYFPNMLIEIKDGFGSTFTNTTFRGYVNNLGERKTKLLRLTYNQYQFSNQNTFSNCVFVDARIMLDLKGTANNNFVQCTFQDADLFMVMESVAGKGDNATNFINCWYEEFQRGVVNSKVDESTLEPVVPLAGVTDISKIRNTNNAFSNDGYNMPEFWLNKTVEPFWYKHYSMHDDSDYKNIWKRSNSVPITINKETNTSGSFQNTDIKWNSFREVMLICKTLNNFKSTVIIPNEALKTFGWLGVPIADRVSGAAKIVTMSNDTKYLNISVSYESDIIEVTDLYIR